ncbi:MAG: zinc-dependent peptidase [Planctomycetes bacterium]|nr:zinc-dependent peptidase [Planctomycetota bacterium]
MKVWDRAAHAWAIAGALTLGGLGALLAASGDLGIGIAAAAIGPVWYLLLMRRSFRRLRLSREPVPPEWREVLEKNVPAYRRLAPDRKAAFERDVAIFVRENSFRGVDGVEATDELKVLAATSAILLLFGRTEREFPKIGEILFYPRSFDEDYRSHGDIAGLVHPHGTVVLSAPDLRRSFAAADGFHVGLHEFAHLLDLAGGTCDGVPIDLDPKLVQPWCRLAAAELERIRTGRGALRAYGGTNEAEFWAVAVEAFFEQPEALRRGNAELYAILEEYFGRRAVS